MMLGLFGLGGILPLSGFVGKFLLFSVTSLIRETDYFVGKQRLGAMFCFLTQLSAMLTCLLLIVGIVLAI